jgi:hypothetical protein
MSSCGYVTQLLLLVIAKLFETLSTIRQEECHVMKVKKRILGGLHCRLQNLINSRPYIEIHDDILKKATSDVLDSTEEISDMFVMGYN